MDHLNMDALNENEQRARIAKINRRLDRKGLKLKRCREDSRYYYQYGRYYIISLDHGGIMDDHVDIDELAHEEGARAPLPHPAVLQDANSSGNDSDTLEAIEHVMNMRAIMYRQFNHRVSRLAQASGRPIGAVDAELRQRMRDDGATFYGEQP